MNRFIYLLAKCNQGQAKIGVKKGPQLLSKFTNQQQISINNKHFNTQLGYKKIKENVEMSLKNKLIPITLGGDHSISLGSISGTLDYFNQDLTVVWIDAHADINTKESSSSGNLHGMPLSYLTGMSEGFSFQNKKLNPKNLIYIGIRDLDPFESQIIENLNIQYLTSKNIMDDISLLDNMKINTNNIHMSVDVDVLDYNFMPCTGTIVDNGIDIESLEKIISWTKKQGNIVSADLVEFNPCIGTTSDFNLSIQICKRIIDNLEKI